MPIVTTLDTGPGRQEEAPKPNFKTANWPKFKKELTKELESLNAQDEVHNESKFYRRLNALMLAITGTIESVIPKNRLSPYAKRRWSKEQLQN